VYPVAHYFLPSGSAAWSPIDSTLAAVPGRAGWWRSKANSWAVSFAPPGAQGGSEQFEVGGQTVGFVPEAVAATAGPPAVSGSTATFRALWSQVDARYNVSPSGVDESLIVGGAGAPASFGFDLVGMTAKLNSSGGLDLTAAGSVVGSVPPVSVATARGPVSAAVAGVSLAVTADASGRRGGRVVVAVDRRWLSGLASSAFPVVIDPTFNPTTAASTGGSLAPVSISSSNSTLGGYLQVGTDAGGVVWNAEGYFAVPATPTSDGSSQPWVLSSAIMNLVYGAGSKGPGALATLA
jgi:hypothetical protein